MFINLIKRPDNSYVIDRHGYPYHVPPTGEFMELWEEVNIYALEHPDEVEMEKEAESPTLAQIQTAKREELKAAYEHAFANAIDPADPSPTNVAVKAALWAAKDADGLLALRDRLDKDCKRMEAAIDSCTTIQEVEEIEIAFSL